MSAHSRRGMTLFEAMIAITVLLVMSLLVMETMRGSVQFKDLLEDRDNVTRQARVALSKLRRDIALAYLTPAWTSVETVQTVFVGLDEDPDTLYFATLAHRRIYRDSRECDQAEISVWAEKGPTELGSGYVLYHRESPRVDEFPDEQGTVYPLAYNVQSFNLRYLDPIDNEWKEEWDTRNSETNYRMPRAVEIGLVLLTPDPDDTDRTVEVPFMTTVNLHFSDKIVNKNNAKLNGNPGPFGGKGLMGNNLAMAGGWSGGGSVGSAGNARRNPGASSGGSSGFNRNAARPQGGKINAGSVLRNGSTGSAGTKR